MERTTLYLALAAVLAVAGVGLAGCLSNGTSTPTTDTTSASAAHTVYVNLDIATRANSAGDQLDAYLPANVTVPANTTVVFTIKSYDPDPNPVSQNLAKVQGTVGNTMTVNGKQVSSVDNTTVSHTMTISDGPNGGTFNVPIPASPSDSQPSVVTFKVVFHHGGTFTYYCEAPCDPGSMGRVGWMAGHLTVVA